MVTSKEMREVNHIHSHTLFPSKVDAVKDLFVMNKFHMTNVIVVYPHDDEIHIIAPPFYEFMKYSIFYSFIRHIKHYANHIIRHKEE